MSGWRLSAACDTRSIFHFLHSLFYDNKLDLCIDRLIKVHWNMSEIVIAWLVNLNSLSVFVSCIFFGVGLLVLCTVIYTREIIKLLTNFFLSTKNLRFVISNSIAWFLDLCCIRWYLNAYIIIIWDTSNLNLYVIAVLKWDHRFSLTSHEAKQHRNQLYYIKKCQLLSSFFSLLVLINGNLKMIVDLGKWNVCQNENS